MTTSKHRLIPGMIFPATRTDEWGNMFVSCPFCKREYKSDGVVKHIKLMVRKRLKGYVKKIGPKKKHSKMHNRRISLSMMGHRRNVGRKASPENRANMRAAQQLRRQNER